MIELAVTATPIGPLTLAVRDGRVCLLHFGDGEREVRDVLARWYPGSEIERRADPGGMVGLLGRYFSGEVDVLDDVPVEMNGTPFQKRVWAALRTVRAGHTATYAEIASRVGSAAAVRAVGAANGANPVAVVVPCHRIVGSNGTLTGYGGGLETKQWLLRHEGCRLF